MIVPCVNGVRIHLEPTLNWQAWAYPSEGFVLVGTERYPQLVWTIQVRPQVLETDPGPLDARVP